jgi:preprotein translocase subunit SecD
MMQYAKWKTFLILGICFFGVVFASPNLLTHEQRSHLPEWMRPLSLGLDLQGGSQLLLEVDTQAGLKDQLNTLVDSVRGALRKEKIGYTDLHVKASSVTFTIREPSQIPEARKILAQEVSDATIEINADGTGRMEFTAAAIKERTRSMLVQSREMVDRRLNEFGTTEPNIQQQGESNILVQLPGVSDPARVRELLGKTAKMTFRFVHPDSPTLLAQGKIPPGYEKLAGNSKAEAYIVSKQIMLGGENLVNASPGFDTYGRPSVNFKFDTAGGRKFGDITRKNIGRQLAIILDNQVISAPAIHSQITTNGEITGQFDVKETTDLAILMRAGALPAPMHVIEERIVGPDLGADSIEAGKNATILSVVFVTVFMILVYSFFGVMADIAVIFNIILLIAFMSITQSTLTLPGIAGIALTIGMAVDANVLIYERIKEELRNGHKPASAIEAGYTRAMATIVDSNLTTLIGSILLYIFGTGVVRGFAVTTSVGILISMFTAITLTRLIAVYWMRWRRPKTLPI